MKKIEVTYEAMYPLQTGNYEQGEAAFILPMTDELADTRNPDALRRYMEFNRLAIICAKRGYLLCISD